MLTGPVRAKGSRQAERCLNNEKESFCQLFDQTGRVSKSSKVLISPSVSSCSERKQAAAAAAAVR